MKLTLFVLALLATAAFADDGKCRKTVCGSNSAEKVCADYVKADLTVTLDDSKCDFTKQFCDTSKIPGNTPGTAADATGECKDLPTTETPETPEITGLTVGRICSKNSECLSDDCSTTCQGLAKDADCVKHVFGLSTDDLKKICGANLRCVDDKCADGLDADATCVADGDCSDYHFCNSDKKCAAFGSVAKDGTCGNDHECADDLYCTATKCADAPAYEKNKYWGLCADNAECGAKSDCNCTWANTEGKGFCGLVDLTQGKERINARRGDAKGWKQECPLDYKDVPSAGASCGQTYTAYTGDANNRKTGGCYSKFGISTESDDSSFMAGLSFLGFLAYFLY